MHSEDDVSDDPGLANSRDEGGLDPRRRDDGRDDPDGASTAGVVDRNGEFVGRVAGDDPGYAGETGAEKRAAG